MAAKKHEFWIDYIKVFACILVVLGHFFQSIVKASIVPDNILYQWFNTTIYYFHVSLFFICSGYLYQKYSHVDSINAWKNNVIKKAIALGLPYFVFSFATWLLKTVFSGSVNGQIGGLGDTLFLHPTSPYWFLYILFFIFLVTPTVKTLTGMTILLGIAIAGKVLQIIGGGVQLITNLCGIKSPCELDLVCFGNGNSIRDVAKIFFENFGSSNRSSFSCRKPMVV